MVQHLAAVLVSVVSVLIVADNSLQSLQGIVRWARMHILK